MINSDDHDLSYHFEWKKPISTEDVESENVSALSMWNQSYLPATLF